MNPAAPVTRRRMTASLVAALPRLLAQLVDLLPVPLDLLRAIQQFEDAVAVAELVARVRLGERSRPGEAGDGLFEQRQRAGVVTGPHQLVPAVIELARVAGGR